MGSLWLFGYAEEMDSEDGYYDVIAKINSTLADGRYDDIQSDKPVIIEAMLA